MRDVKYVHFSHWPTPKPWLSASNDVTKKYQPNSVLHNTTGTETDCRARDIWLGLYADFKQRRMVRISYARLVVVGITDKQV